MEAVNKFMDHLWRFVPRWFGTLHHVASDLLRTEPEPAPPTKAAAPDPKAEKRSGNDHHKTAGGPAEMTKLPEIFQSAAKTARSILNTTPPVVEGPDEELW